ncbi:hypothetical protein JYU34_016427 [Plutella xylostella]|uniref:Cuticular protein n=1 Tax=Plutella xylostella TaxID=51655 RepID=A0ABQ7Q2M8_PLUXY|nr:hypothetical protein JYU34_016427 [Plutella xylostella]
MKFLVLALCVCAASAASFPSYNARATAYVTKPVAPAAYRTPTFAAVRQVARPVAPAYVQAVSSVEVPAPAPVVKSVTVEAAPALPVRSAAFASHAQVKNVNYNNEGEAVIVRSENEILPEGFNYAYETGNGIFAESSGTLKRVDNTEAVVVRGSYRYVAPDGTPVEVRYIADENGFQPEGNVLPVAPAIPEAIQRSLQYIAAHPAQVEQSYRKL